jgi:hypothetical protein
MTPPESPSYTWSRTQSLPAKNGEQANSVPSYRITTSDGPTSTASSADIRAMNIIKGIFALLGGKKRFDTISDQVENYASLDEFSAKLTNNPKLVLPKPKLVLPKPTGYTGNESVNPSGVTRVLGDYVSNPDDYCIFLLGHFIQGTGAENYIFAHNSDASKRFCSIPIVLDRVFAWVADSSVLKSDKPITLEWQHVPFDAADFALETTDGIGNLADYAGSVEMKCTYDNATGVFYVQVFNVTSLKSGDIAKKLLLNTATSLPRSVHGDLPFSNISQFASATFTYNELLLAKIKHAIGVIIPMPKGIRLSK